MQSQKPPQMPQDLLNDQYHVQISMLYQFELYYYYYLYVAVHDMTHMIKWIFFIPTLCMSDADADLGIVILS